MFRKKTIATTFATFMILSLVAGLTQVTSASTGSISAGEVLKVEKRIQDGESFTEDFLAKAGEAIRFAVSTESLADSNVAVQIQDSNENDLLNSQGRNFDQLFVPTEDNEGTWRFWVWNPGFAGGDFINVVVEVTFGVDPSGWTPDQTNQTDSSNTELTDGQNTTTTEVQDDGSEYPSKVVKTVEFPYYLDLGDQGNINNTLRIMTAVVPEQIYGLNGREPLTLNVSVGKYLSTANANLDNLSLFGALEGGWIVPFYTPFVNQTTNLVSVGALSAALVLDVTYVAHLNVTEGAGILTNTTLRFDEPESFSITLNFTKDMASGDKVLINVTWVAEISSRVVLKNGEDEFFTLKEKVLEEKVGYNETFAVEIDKKETAPGFELVSILVILPAAVLVQRRRKKH